MEIKVGDKFGKWTVIEIGVSFQNRIGSKVKCECGFERLIRNRDLRNNNSRQCVRCNVKNRPGKHYIKIGDKFGSWEVIEIDLRKNGSFASKCKCKCGKVAILRNYMLIYNRSKSCNSCAHIGISPIKIKIGEQFGNWIVLETNISKNTNIYCKCRCKCGVEKLVSNSNLINNKSTGCRRCHKIKYNIRARGLTREYASWSGAQRRCTNYKDSNYDKYGGAGITFHKEWTDDFESFFKYMGKRPKGTTLDRHPNPDGNYEPGNCRWATQKEQNANRRNSPAHRNNFIMCAIKDLCTKCIKKVKKIKNENNNSMPEGQLSII